jgi:1-acyl-sn-glycerol-3-phosphate acyltransferase
MNALQTFVSGMIWTGTNLSCHIDSPQLARVPARGPLILAVNHINSLEVPLLLSQLYPRRMIGLAKIETWNSKFMGWLFDLYDAIPIRRGEVDLEAMRRCLNSLSAGDILAVAPEGTRSYNGKLLPGRPGIVLLALRSGAPILPVVHWGGERYGHNLKRLKRTDFHIRVGTPFTLDAHGERVTSEIRQAMADEIMYQMAVLMPDEYRGQYADCDPPPQKYLQFK